MKLTQKELFKLEEKGFYFDSKQLDEPLSVFGNIDIAKEIEYYKDEKEFFVNGNRIVENDEVYLLIDRKKLSVDNLVFSYYNEYDGTEELEFNLSDDITVFIKNILPDEKVDEIFWENESNIKHYVNSAEVKDIDIHYHG